MSANARKAIAGGFNGSGGDGPKSELDRLIDRMAEIGKRERCHPIHALHVYESPFYGFPSIDLRVEACKRYISQITSGSLSRQSAAKFEIIINDYPEGYLAKALDDLQVDDFDEWLKSRTMSHDVVYVEFGAPR